MPKNNNRSIVMEGTQVMPPRRPSSDSAMEVSTGCHHTSNHSVTLGATSVSLPHAPKNQSEPSPSPNEKHGNKVSAKRPNAHRGSQGSNSHKPELRMTARGQFGFAVNGFHPQWSTSSNLLLASHARELTAFPVSLHNDQQPSLNEQVVSATNDLINRLRNDEEEKKNIRKRHLAEAAVAAAKAQKRRARESPRAEQASVADSTSSSGSTTSTDCPQKRESFPSLYGDVFLKSCTPQILVSPGGRILAWNDRFVQVSELNADQIAESLTIFNLVQPKYIPRLFDLFALALRGGSPPPLVLQQSPLAPGNMLGRLNSKLSASRGGSTVTDEGESAALSGIEGGNHGTNDDSSMSESRSTVVSSSGQEEEEEDGDECDKRNEEEAEENDDTEYHHASMTVPCAHFPSGQALFLMTITLMNDENPNKRCFHCVFEGQNCSSQKSTDKSSTSKDESIAKRQAVDSSSFGKIRHITYADLAIQL